MGVERKGNCGGEITEGMVGGMGGGGRGQGGYWSFGMGLGMMDGE